VSQPNGFPFFLYVYNHNSNVPSPQIAQSRRYRKKPPSTLRCWKKATRLLLLVVIPCRVGSFLLSLSVEATPPEDTSLLLR
jgi:hypothetical protein